MKYAFIERHEHEHSVRRMCKIMTVHPSGYYAWKADPVSPRAQDDQRLLGLLKHAWLESGDVYGYRKLTLDMRDLGESCGKHRVARLLKLEGLRSQTGYRRRPGMRGGKPAVVAPNHLQRQFTVAQPNQSWVTDITYIRTHEGWLYLAVVVDLFSRQVVGWSMGSRIDTGLVLDALVMALWRRRPKQPVTVHSDQGSQGAFNRSSQHRVVERILGTRSRSQPVSSSPAFYAACCSRSGPRLESHARSSEIGQCLLESIGVGAHLCSRSCRAAMGCEGQQRRP